MSVINATMRTIEIDGTAINPQEFIINELDWSSATGMVLQQWLQVLYPEMVTLPYSNAKFEQAIVKLKTDYQLSPTDPHFNTPCWNAIQQAMFNLNRRKRANQLKVNFNSSDKSVLRRDLKSMGIHVNGDDEIGKGLRLLEAIMRGTTQFEKSIDNDLIENYTELIDQKFQFSDATWQSVRHSWQLFYGAPWLGIVIETIDDELNKWSWCSVELAEKLYSLGEEHFKKLVDKKSMTYALENPLVIIHLSGRLGGNVLGNNQFSQIGTQAAIAVNDFSPQRLEWLNDCIKIVDPAWQIRKKGKLPPPDPAQPDAPPTNTLSNIQLVDKPMEYGIFEVKPELEYILRKPHRIHGHLQKKPSFFSTFPLKRFALAIAQRKHTMSSDELAIVFKSIKGLGIEVLMDFMLELRNTRALGEVLYRIHTEGNDIVQDILQLHYESLGFDVQKIKDKIVEWEEYLVRFFVIESQLKEGNDLLQAAWELAKEEAIKQVKEKIQPDAA